MLNKGLTLEHYTHAAIGGRTLKLSSLLMCLRSEKLAIVLQLCMSMPLCNSI